MTLRIYHFPHSGDPYFECSLLWSAGAIPSFPMSATFVEEAGSCIDPAVEASD